MNQARPHNVRHMMIAVALAIWSWSAHGATIPINAYSATTNLPATVRLVAVLPVTAEFSAMDVAVQGSVLLAELRQSGRFELLPVQSEDLQHWSGRGAWRTTEKLPAGFLARIREASGADAVLFCHLSQYQPYPPMAIGWKLQLVDTVQGTPLWATDVILDASDPRVAAAAGCYGRTQTGNLDKCFNSSGILLSPKRFGQYVAGAVLRTLPMR